MLLGVVGFAVVSLSVIAMTVVVVTLVLRLPTIVGVPHR